MADVLILQRDYARLMEEVLEAEIIAESDPEAKRELAQLNMAIGATAIFIDGSAGTQSTIVTGFPLPVKDGGGYINGTFTLTLLNSSTNVWAGTHMLEGDGGCVSIGGGTKALSAELTQLTVAGNTFDLGQVNIMYSS